MDSSIQLVTNEEIARILFRIASLFEITEDNPYRVRAYRRAALGVLLMKREVADFIVAGEDLPLPGVGDRIRARLYELVNTGQMGVYEAFLEELGEPLASLLMLDGVGPKTAIRLVRELGLASLQDLADAARAGKIEQLRGFGPRKQARIGEQVENLLNDVA